MSEQKKKPWTIAQWIYYGVVTAIIGLVLTSLGSDNESSGIQLLGIAAFVIAAGMVLVGVIKKGTENSQSSGS